MMLKSVKWNRDANVRAGIRSTELLPGIAQLLIQCEASDIILMYGSSFLCISWPCTMRRMIDVEYLIWRLVVIILDCSGAFGLTDWDVSQRRLDFRSDFQPVYVLPRFDILDSSQWRFDEDSHWTIDGAWWNASRMGEIPSCSPSPSCELMVK